MLAELKALALGLAIVVNEDVLDPAEEEPLGGTALVSWVRSMLSGGEMEL